MQVTVFKIREKKTPNSLIGRLFLWISWSFNPRTSPLKKKVVEMFRSCLYCLLGKWSVNVLVFIYLIVRSDGCTTSTCQNVTLRVTLNSHHRSNFDETRRDDVFYCPVGPGSACITHNRWLLPCEIVRFVLMQGCTDNTTCWHIGYDVRRVSHIEQSAQPRFSVRGVHRLPGPLRCVYCTHMILYG